MGDAARLVFNEVDGIGISAETNSVGTAYIRIIDNNEPKAAKKG